MAFCRDIPSHEINPNPGDILKVKNPEFQGFWINPGDKNPETKKNPKSRRFSGNPEKIPMVRKILRIMRFFLSSPKKARSRIPSFGIWDLKPRINNVASFNISNPTACGLKNVGKFKPNLVVSKTSFRPKGGVRISERRTQHFLPSRFKHLKAKKLWKTWRPSNFLPSVSQFSYIVPRLFAFWPKSIYCQNLWNKIFLTLSIVFYIFVLNSFCHCTSIMFNMIFPLFKMFKLELKWANKSENFLFFFLEMRKYKPGTVLLARTAACSVGER